MSLEKTDVGPTLSSPTDSEHICIVVLNWNGWRDTIECLESIFHLHYPHYTVVVCDNGSSDNSLQNIRNWAEGVILGSPSDSKLPHLISPDTVKPIPYVFFASPDDSLRGPVTNTPLVLIQTGANLGFAGGVNVGLRYALSRTDCNFVWLLNNDTVVERHSLTHLVETMKSEPRVGICGSAIFDYYSPQTVQALGGRRYSVWSGRVMPQIGSTGYQPPLQPIDYVHGASMLVSRAFLESIGLLDEKYFLYFEELDWAMRAKNHFLLSYSPLSFVYHKEGASIGTNSRRRNRSVLSERYATRNRLLFTRKFYPAFVPTVCGWVLLTAIQRLFTGQPGKAGTIFAAAWEGLMCPKA